MPIFKKIRNNKGAVLIIWHIKEDDFFFKTQLPAHIFNHLSNIKSPLARLQKFTTRLIINKITGFWQLDYDAKGAPIIEKNYISISHCKNFVCVYYNSEKIGVDIELTDKRILKIADRFLNKYEKNNFDKNNLHTLTLIWSAKEAVFKKYGGETTFFASSITIKTIQNNVINAEIKTSDFFAEELLYFETINDLVLVYTL